jgi:hypothetical protein
MSGRQGELAMRRQNLQRKAAEQRRELGGHVVEIEARFAGVDRTFVRARSLAQKPIVLGAGAALFFLLGPRRLMALAGKAAMVVSIARRAMRWASS